MKIYFYTNKIKNFLLDIMFPIKCTGCQIKNEILCDNCIAKISLNDKELDENIKTIFSYKDPIIKKVIWELKYHNKRYLGEKLGKLLYEYLLEDISDIKMDISGRTLYIIPIPISRNKTKLRGYNQALMIAKGFCNSGGKAVFELKNEIIVKKVDTIPQAKITNKKMRLENVKNVFEIKNKEILKGRTIIVIDDVVTTGGTIKEMMRILKKAGAKRVFGFTIAH